MLELILIIVSLLVLVAATYVDIKTLEVPDWVNYSGIAAGLGIHLIFSAQQWNWWPIASSAIGFGIGFAIACLMFYTAQWGGGDAKLLMALGALIGFEADKFGFGMSFLVNLVIVGGLWGLVWSAVLAIRNRKRFWNAFKKIRQLSSFKRLRIISMITATLLVIFSFILLEFQFPILALALATYFLCYVTIFIKSVELSCLHQWVTPDQLTEGDWLLQAVKVGKQQLVPPRLGLEKKHVNLLKRLYKQKKLKKVKVKYGVPFAPAFLIAFVATLFVGNVVLALIV